MAAAGTVVVEERAAAAATAHGRPGGRGGRVLVRAADPRLLMLVEPAAPAAGWAGRCTGAQGAEVSGRAVDRARHRDAATIALPTHARATGSGRGGLGGAGGRAGPPGPLTAARGKYGAYGRKGAGGFPASRSAGQRSAQPQTWHAPRMAVAVARRGSPIGDGARLSANDRSVYGSAHALGREQGGFTRPTNATVTLVNGGAHVSWGSTFAIEAVDVRNEGGITLPQGGMAFVRPTDDRALCRVEPRSIALPAVAPGEEEHIVLAEPLRGVVATALPPQAPGKQPSKLGRFVFDVTMLGRPFGSEEGLLKVDLDIDCPVIIEHLSCPKTIAQNGASFMCITVANRDLRLATGATRHDGCLPGDA